MQIITWGNPILKQPAQKVPQTDSPKLQELVDTLFETMEARQGIGIAAPQIGIPLAVLIVSSKPNARYPDAPYMPPQVMVNPEISHYSEQQSYGWEGCLSIPGWRTYIKRSDEITISFDDWQGKRIEKHYQGFPARVVQHEYDHIIGKSLFDRVEGSHHIMSQTEYDKQVLGIGA